VKQGAERGADKASRAASDAKYAAEDGAEKAKKVAQDGKEKASGTHLCAYLMWKTLNPPPHPRPASLGGTPYWPRVLDLSMDL